MFESLSHLALQQYWWIIISLLGAILVFLLFVQGGQTLIYTLGKTDMERRLIVNSLGRKWEFTFTTLVTFGGAFFASFPLFYSTSFGGAYWVWMLILFAFIIQAISYEYRSKPDNFLGTKTYEVFLFINGALGTILLGTAVATFFTGSEFSVNEMNFSRWEGAARGLELALNIHNVSLGLAVFFLARVLAILYFMNNIEDESIFNRSRKQLILNAILFVIFFLLFAIWLMFIDGFAYDSTTKIVSYESHKYLHNFLQMPLVLIIFLLGVVLVLFGIGKSIMKTSTNGIWFSGAGTILTVFALFLIAGFNDTAFYPSTFDLQSSLTIENASSSKYTLKAMTYVSLMVPFVIAYIWYAWKSINNKKINTEEMGEDIHIY
ncbi:MAG: cytochrome d ubiquinol oxidase subunit II [Marinilabiliales bacterium]|nr:MAG: cytochrome d ubiquinol oxidase subunit II [Marinilabiliales bacterium]